MQSRLELLSQAVEDALGYLNRGGEVGVPRLRVAQERRVVG